MLKLDEAGRPSGRDCRYLTVLPHPRSPGGKPQRLTARVIIARARRTTGCCRLLVGCVSGRTPLRCTGVRVWWRSSSVRTVRSPVHQPQPTREPWWSRAVVPARGGPTPLPFNRFWPGEALFDLSVCPSVCVSVTPERRPKFGSTKVRALRFGAFAQPFECPSLRRDS